MNTTKLMKFGIHELDFSKKTFVMGILNITPDSFSDGGKYNDIDLAVLRAIRMVEEGADIIDIGGESTRPGAVKVSAEEELARVIPIIQAVSNVVDIPISIDTYKYEVAKQAIKAGATIINDVWGAKAEPKIAELAANYKLPIVLTHNRDNKNYTNLINDMIADLQVSIAICEQAGVEHDKIILDPGIGFAKAYDQNIEVMQNLDRITALGYPVLLGTSRKSMIGMAQNLPAEERLEGTQATVCYGVMKGCQIMRVHDVLQISRTAQMMDVLMGRSDLRNG
jgi:dihydropteroate synthase